MMNTGTFFPAMVYGVPYVLIPNSTLLHATKIYQITASGYVCPVDVSTGTSCGSTRCTIAIVIVQNSIEHHGSSLVKFAGVTGQEP